MHLIEIVIDGFKSYSARTSVEQLDPQFNAITGLNGSGKSNILDAICFVMGISRLGYIRVEKMQELVYKGGNSSVSKASVTLIFDNTKKDSSPPAYTQMDKISVTRSIDQGKVKCLINGKIVTQEQVKELFQSVKLNVNNPHFLIMQGRVTKVINMKPSEILSLIEEASGVSMYQSKRQQSTDLIKKKDLKIAETNNILENEVIPQFENLKKDKQNFDEFQQTEKQLEEHQKQLRLYQYNNFYNTVNNKQSQSKLEQDRQQFTQRFKDQKIQLQHVKAKLEKKIQEHSDSKQAKDLEEKLEKVSKDITKCESQIKFQEEQLQKLESNERKVQKEVKKMILERDAAQRKLAKLQEFQNTNQIEIQKLNEEIKTVDANIGKFESGDAADHQVQLNRDLQRANNSLEETKNQIKLIKTEQMRAKQRMTELQENLKRLEQISKSDQKQEESLRQLIIAKEEELKTLNYQPQQLKQKDIEIQQIEMSQRPENLERQQGREFCQFDYKLPNAQFNKQLVHGLIGTLFTVKNIEEHGIAITQLLGGRFYNNVVVEKQEVGTQLIKFGGLQQRMTFLPLDIKYNQQISQENLERAYRVTNGECRLIVGNLNPNDDLIQFKPQYRNVMLHLLGNWFMCSNEQYAKDLSAKRNGQQGQNCITIKGDTYMAAGTLSGGDNNKNGGNRIQQIANYLKVQENQTGSNQRLFKLKQDQKVLREQQSKYDDIQNHIANLKKKLEHFGPKNMGGTSAQQQLELENSKIQKIENQMEDLEEDLKKNLENEKKLETQIPQIKTQLQNKGSTDQLSYIKDKRKQLVDERNKKQKLAENKIQELLQTEDDLKTIEADLKKSEATLVEDQTQVGPCQIELRKQCVLLDESKNKHEDLLKQQEVEKKKIGQQSQEISKLETEAQNLEDLIKETEVQIKICEQDLSSFQNSIKLAEQKLRQMQKDYPTIDQELALTRAAVEQMDPKSTEDEISKLKEKHSDLKKRINVNIELMFDKTDKWHQELIRKKETLAENKAHLEETIKQLDIEKNKDLDKTVKEVDKNLGDIFSVLLTQAHARLHRVVGIDGVLTGLQLKVAFNGVEKESLTELSGGQRSLLALSLILALLKYQPAPLYILDEIDSALDLSHTQNIGLMIRKYFPMSQFLIVSLKEGLFQNANVLFKIQFKDNRSTVQRFQMRKPQQN